jgi:hypothetical protein
MPDQARHDGVGEKKVADSKICVAKSKLPYAVKPGLTRHLTLPKKTFSKAHNPLHLLLNKNENRFIATPGFQLSSTAYGFSTTFTQSSVLFLNMS